MSERDTSFLKHAFVYGVGALALHAASVVLLPLYTRYLAPTEFGILEIVDRIGQVFRICFMVNGIRNAALTFYRQAQDVRERETTASTITLLLVVALLLAGCLVLAFAGPIGRLLRIDDASLVAFGVIVVMMEVITAVPLALMQARLESFQYVFTNVAMLLLRVSLTIVAVAALGWGVWGVLVANAVTTGSFGILLTIREMVKGSFRPDFARLKPIIRFTLPFVPAGVFGLAFRAGDRFFLAACVGLAELGVYSLGFKLATIAGILSFEPLMQVWSARKFDVFDQPDGARGVGRAFTRMLGAYLLMGVGICVFREEVMLVFGSPQYAGATAVVGIIVLARFFAEAARLFDSALFVRRKTYLKPWISGATAVVILGLHATLIPKFGMMGAAFSTLGGFAFFALATFFVSQRVFRVEYEWLRLAVMLGLAIAVVGASTGLGTGFLAVSAKLGLWLAWPFLLWQTNVVTQEEKHFLVSSARSAIRRLAAMLPRQHKDADSAFRHGLVQASQLSAGSEETRELLPKSDP